MYRKINEPAVGKSVLRLLIATSHSNQFYHSGHILYEEDP